MEDLVALLRPIYAAREVEEGLRTMLAICDPAVELELGGMWLDQSGVRRGHAEVAGFFRQLEDAFGEYWFEPERFEQRDQSVAVATRLEVRGRLSGISDSRSVGHLWVFRGGQVVAIRSFHAAEEAFAAL